MDPSATHSLAHRSCLHDLEVAKRNFIADKTIETARRYRTVVERELGIIHGSRTYFQHTIEILTRAHPEWPMPRAPMPRAPMPSQPSQLLLPPVPSFPLQGFPVPVRGLPLQKIRYHRELSITKQRYAEENTPINARSYKSALQKALQVAQIRFNHYSGLKSKLEAYETSCAELEMGISMLLSLKSRAEAEIQEKKDQLVEIAKKPEFEFSEEGGEILSSSSSDDEDFEPSEVGTTRKESEKRKESLRSHSKSSSKQAATEETVPTSLKRKRDESEESSSDEFPTKKAKK